MIAEEIYAELRAVERRYSRCSMISVNYEILSVIIIRARAEAAGMGTSANDYITWTYI